MSDLFEEYIARLLSHEGGYSSDRTDPGNWTGGRVGVGVLKGTKFGIAANTYPNIDIKNLTWEKAKAIYHRDFWLAAKCDKLPSLVAFQLLDGAVNSGIPNATRWLQRAVGVADDGAIGPFTLAAINKADKNDMVMLFLAERLDFMTSLRNWPNHGKGWARRIAANLRWASRDN
jgi:lysozyme family protein